MRALQTSADTTTPVQEPNQSEPFTVKLHEESFHTYHCDAPELELEVTKERLLTMYSQMTTMRRMEMAADALYKAKLIRGFCHLAIGQVRVLVLVDMCATERRPGSYLGRLGTRYHPRGPCHHRLPLPSLRSAARRHHHRCTL